MKKSLTLTFSAFVAACSLLGVGAAHAQESSEKKVRDELRAANEESRKQMEEARQNLAQTKRQVEELQAGMPGNWDADDGVQGQMDRLQKIMGVRAPESGARSLVVLGSDAAAKERPNIEQDLAVMGHILNKAVAETLGADRQPRTAMGIHVFFPPNSGAMRSLYLEGYGALFTLNVGFPLLPPPRSAEADKEKPAADTDWDEARRELYGRPDEPRRFVVPTEPYDEAQVNRLKESLLDALKNASNIRGLKADDSVTVCVLGGSPIAGAKRILGPQNPPNEPPNPPSPRAGRFEERMTVRVNAADGAARNSTMTLRAKKSDIDTFAKGKLTLEDFRKKATVAIY